jgi:hypothetical protein
MMHKLRIAMVRPGRIRLHKVNDASGQSLIPAIIESVQPNSEVFTDAWEGYSQLASSGYKIGFLEKHRMLVKISCLWLTLWLLC